MAQESQPSSIDALHLNQVCGSVGGSVGDCTGEVGVELMCGCELVCVCACACMCVCVVFMCVCVYIHVCVCVCSSLICHRRGFPCPHHLSTTPSLWRRQKTAVPTRNLTLMLCIGKVEGGSGEREGEGREREREGSSDQEPDPGAVHK